MTGILKKIFLGVLVNNFKRLDINFSNLLSDEIKNAWRSYSLDTSILNENRLRYLEYHNTLLRT